MADVSAVPPLLEQIRAVSWLRWRTLRNNLRNKNRRLDILGLVISSVISLLFVGGMTVGFFIGTIALFEKHDERYFGLVFLGLLVWWQLFPVLLAGFSPQFSFRTMLRFPMRLPAFYIIGLAYGFADSAALAALVWLVTMVVATLVAQPAAAPVMLVACVLFALFNVTLERLLGAWVEKLLTTRRSREIFFTLFILSMVSLNFLNPIMQKYGKAIVAAMRGWLPYLCILPSSFAGDAIARFSEQDWLGVISRFAGLVVYVLLFSFLLWKRYAKIYEGEELSESSEPTKNKVRIAADSSGPSEALEFLPPAVLAIFRKELIYLRRNSFLFFGLVFPPMMLLFFTVQFAGLHPTALKQGVSPDLFFPGMMAYLVLILIAPSYNSFAYEGRGIQTYFMSPVTFRSVLIAKNLLTIAILTAEIVFCVVLLGWRVGLPSTPVLFATLAAVAFSIMGQLSLANWASLSYPKRVQFGKMGQRNSGMSVLVVFGAQLLFSGVSAIILFSGRWTGNRWLPAEIFAVFAAAATAGYLSGLDACVALAERKKETLLEALCR